MSDDFVLAIVLNDSSFLLPHQLFYLIHHFASDVSFGIIKHLLTRYSGNSKFIKLHTFHLRTPICIKHTPKWQNNINKYKNVYNLIYYTTSISQFNTFKDNSNWNSGHQNHKKEWNQEKRTFSIIKQITHSWEGGRGDYYPEKVHCQPRLRLGWQWISRGNNLLYHPLSYVLFIYYYIQLRFVQYMRKNTRYKAFSRN